MLLLIGAAKLLKGLLLVVIGTEALRLADKNLQKELTHWVQQLNVDPHNHYFRMFLEKIAGFDSHKLSLWGIGTFFYSAIFFTEGIGLMFKKRWAEILTVVVTASFLPLETYELLRHFHGLKLALIIVNLAIVWYLIWRLGWETRAAKKSPPEAIS